MALVFTLTASSVSAETLMMPNRDMLMGVSEVVWGVTTQDNGTPYSMNFGDGNVVNGNVIDRSYITFNHAYALAGTFTATLTVGGESATVEIRVYDPGTLSAADLRGLNINRTIQNGHRYLWVSQISRAANFPNGPTTSWGGTYPASVAALVVAAFQNHGYSLPNNNNAPTGLYEKYIVRRGLNYVFSLLSNVALSVQPAGNPCVGLGAAPDPCVGFQLAGNHSGYQTPVATLALAGSGALSRTNTEVAGVTNGKTYAEILQRLTNAITWGQGENGNGRGGWTYVLNSTGTSDGSTIGWSLLALLDAQAAGAVIPNFVKTEFAIALNNAHNDNGSLDYQANGSATSYGNTGIEKGGIPLQGLFFLGETLPFAPGSRAEATFTYITNRWTSGRIGGDYNWGCQASAAPVHPAATVQYNFGCAYSMYNIFKGLGLYGISNLPGVGDWYGQYQDWLVANQTSPTSTSGGNWATLQFSCCESNMPLRAAMAELILSPVVLIAPDPTLFSTVGLSPATATNPVGTNHTVTATAQSAGGTPVPGATVNFQVMIGPNAGKTGQGSTNAQGQTTFTYTDTGGPGTDQIQAFIGNLGSNVVDKHWVLAVTRCDADGDGNIDRDDLLIIRNANRQPASSPTDPRDGNGDGLINVADVRYCQLLCTRPGCAVQ